MKKPRFLFAALATVLVLPMAHAQQGGVAVLDIDRVAKELRIDQSVASDLKEVETSLNAQLAQVRSNLQTQMNQIEANLGQQKTPEAQTQLVEANRKLNADFAAVRTEAQNRLTAARVQRINEFRDKLRPLAQAAAKEKGLEVVVTVSPQLYAFVPEVDITEAVIRAAKEAGLEQPEPPAPDPQAAPAAVPASGAATPAKAAETPTSAPAGKGKK
jgi:Skp family chaperone for outer membrane proteins